MTGSCQRAAPPAHLTPLYDLPPPTPPPPHSVTLLPRWLGTSYKPSRQHSEPRPLFVPKTHQKLQVNGLLSRPPSVSTSSHFFQSSLIPVHRTNVSFSPFVSPSCDLPFLPTWRYFICMSLSKRVSQYLLNANEVLILVDDESSLHKLN